ncbi:MAG: sigma-70 family RNA polymerase sigma factor, partial [Treponema sp.]|nr:sigma-70 family RNA polymerase sigma factor [Treponema sp.]
MGNSDAFAQLMSLYKQRVFIFGKSFFHNDTDTEDFVQDVFIKVYTHLKSFKGKSQFSTWLMKIAYTTVLTSVQRKKEYLPIADEENIVDFDMTPEEMQI